MPRRILLVVKGPPYGNILVAECFRIATAMIAMDVLPQILFIDDGVCCLLKGQDPEKAGLRLFHERLKTLADLIGLCVAEESLNRRNLKKTDLDENYNLKKVSMEEVTNLFLENETVITF
ncbi:MAG: DsrE family protein [Candidatus Bathyarchaeota archaeon]|nr:DsrE family protein [Candidatus Bathyarchaeota archaeon]